MKKNSKKILLGIVFIVIGALIGFGNLEYILNGESIENIAYRAGQVLTSENGINEIEVANINDEYIFENNGELKVYIFDVGQADCILVMNGNQTMLIDAGNNADGKFIVNQLQKMNITRMDYLIGTHPHEDHIGGLDDVIKSFDIDKIYMPKKTTNTKTYEDVLSAITSKKLKITTPKIGDSFYLGGAKCEIMNVDNDAEDLNETSIVIELTYGDKKFLFTGDTETTKEKERIWNDIDVLKVAHHGSSTSTSKDFLNQTKPEFAIISCGINNDYGHPHKEIITRLKEIETYRTDKDGTILVTCDGSDIKIEKLDIDLNGNQE